MRTFFQVRLVNLTTPKKTSKRDGQSQLIKQTSICQICIAHNFKGKFVVSFDNNTFNVLIIYEKMSFVVCHVVDVDVSDNCSM